MSEEAREEEMEEKREEPMWEQGRGRRRAFMFSASVVAAVSALRGWGLRCEGVERGFSRGGESELKRARVRRRRDEESLAARARMRGISQP